MNTSIKVSIKKPIKTSLRTLGLVLSSVLVLTACNTSTPIKVGTQGQSAGYDALKYGKAKQPTNFDQDGNPHPWKPKTIAVTDISYSAEFRDAFYFEENKIKKSENSNDIKSESTVPQVTIPSLQNNQSAPDSKEKQPLEKPTSSQRQDRKFDDKRVDMHTVGFMTVQDKAEEILNPFSPSQQLQQSPQSQKSQKSQQFLQPSQSSPPYSSKLPDLPTPPAPPTIPPAALNKFQEQQGIIPGNAASNAVSDPAGNAPTVVNKSETSKSSNFEQSYTKKYGVERKINYGEIRGLSGPIKGMLIKAGYRVAQGRPNIQRTDQNDDYFDIIKRIKSGDFDGADYVLYGVLTGLTLSDNSAPITGTQNSMAINSLDIAVDFSLIDTATYQVVASFVATGSGSDNRIDGQTEGYKPNNSKMMKQVSASLSENVAYQLGAQEFFKSAFGENPVPARVIPGTDKYRNDESNPRVYK